MWHFKSQQHCLKDLGSSQQSKFSRAGISVKFLAWRNVHHKSFLTLWCFKLLARKMMSGSSLQTLSFSTPHLSPLWLFPGKYWVCTFFYWNLLIYSRSSSSDTLCKASDPNMKAKSEKKEKSLVKLSPSLFWCLITEKKNPNKQTKALFFLFLVWCTWCFCELRNFRAAENLSLAYWIEFFWLLISELLWLFAENFWRAGTGFDSICQQFLFNYRERGEGRSWEILGDTGSPKSAWQEKNKEKQDLVSLAWS